MGEYFGPFDIRVLGLLGWHPGSRVELWVLEDVCRLGFCMMCHPCYLLGPVIFRLP